MKTLFQHLKGGNSVLVSQVNLTSKEQDLNMYSVYQICRQMCRDNTKNQNQICTQSNKDIQRFGIAHRRLRTERRRQRVIRLIGEKLDAPSAGPGDCDIIDVDAANSLHSCVARRSNNFITLIVGGILSRLRPQSTTMRGLSNPPTWPFL